MGSSIAKNSHIMSSASLPSVYEDNTSTAGPLVLNLQKTAKKKETSLNKGNLSSLKASNKETAASYEATKFQSEKDQSRHSLSSKDAASNSSTSTALNLILSDENPPVAGSASTAANYVTVLLDSPAVLPSKLTNFREPSPSVNSGPISTNLYSTSSVVPIWTANMLGNAYGGGYVITPSIFVTSYPDSPSSSGIPPGYERSSKSEDIHSSRSPTRVRVGTGGTLTLIAGPSKQEAASGVPTSSSALDTFIDFLQTAETETDAVSFSHIPSNASNHSLLKPVTVTQPSLTNTVPVNETGMLNTSLLLPSASINLAHYPSISPLVNHRVSLLANQNVIGAYNPTSVLEFQGLAFKKTFHYSLGLICIMALFFIL